MKKYLLGLMVGVVILSGSSNVFAAIRKLGKTDNLGQIISSNPKVVVDFFAPWCGPCKTLAPRLEEVAKQFPDVLFIKADCEEIKNLVSKYTVRGFPTVKFYKNGQIVAEFAGLKAASAIVDIINKKLK